MQYALIKNQNVENVIVAEPDFIQHIQAEWDHIEPLDTLHEQGLGVGIGWTYVNNAFVAPPAPPAPEPVPPPVYEWYIDKGPFFDRFGAQKMAVLLSSDPVIKALLSDINNRHWIDLQRQDVADAVNYIGTVIPAVDSNLKLAILTTPVAAEENLALRKLYFNGQ